MNKIEESLKINLKSVSKFFVVQSTGSAEFEPISDEKEFSSLTEALTIIRISQAPVVWLEFNHDGDSYKLYPIKESQDFTVIKTPTLQ